MAIYCAIGSGCLQEEWVELGSEAKFAVAKRIATTGAPAALLRLRRC